MFYALVLGKCALARTPVPIRSRGFEDASMLAIEITSSSDSNYWRIPRTLREGRGNLPRRTIMQVREGFSLCRADFQSTRCEVHQHSATVESCRYLPFAEFNVPQPTERIGSPTVAVATEVRRCAPPGLREGCLRNPHGANTTTFPLRIPTAGVAVTDLDPESLARLRQPFRESPTSRMKPAPMPGHRSGRCSQSVDRPHTYCTRIITMSISSPVKCTVIDFHDVRTLCCRCSA